MAYGFNFINSLPRLANYKEAAKWEREVKPIRGDRDNLKPLGSRKYKWINICRDPASGDILLRYGAHNDNTFLRYHAKGGKITFGPGCLGAGQHEIISEVLGVSIRTYASKTWVHCATPEFEGGWVPLGKNRTFKNRGGRHGCANLFQSCPEYPVVRTIDRQKSKEARKPYRAFLKQAMGMLKLLDEPGEKETTRWGNTYIRPSPQRAFHELAAKYLPVTAVNTKGVPIIDFGVGRWEWRGMLGRSVRKRDIYPKDLLKLALSSKPDDKLKAILLITGQGRVIGYADIGSLMSAFRKMFDRAIIVCNQNILTTTRVITGKLVKDRFTYIEEYK